MYIADNQRKKNLEMQTFIFTRSTNTRDTKTKLFRHKLLKRTQGQHIIIQVKNYSNYHYTYRRIELLVKHTRTLVHAEKKPS